MEWMHLLGARRYEAVLPDTFSRLRYHEADRVLARWQALAQGITSIQKRLPEDLKPAYYELVYYPIVAGATFYHVKIGAGKNRQYSLEKRNSANSVAEEVREAFESDYDLAHEFHTLLGGKWNGIMSQSKYDGMLTFAI